MVKRIMALVVCLIAAISLNLNGVYAQALADVADTEFETAVTSLVKLGIVSGGPDGNFNPQNNITRAEAAKVVVGLLRYNEEVDQAKGISKFNDVNVDFWATGYINVANAKGLFKGDSQGNFKPGDNITYAETITILLRSLGLAPDIEKSGTWPTNYIEKANELGILSGIKDISYSTKATRGDFAIITWNTLNTVYDESKKSLLEEKFPQFQADSQDEKSIYEIAENIESSVALRIFDPGSSYVAIRSGVIMDDGLIVTNSNIIRDSLRFGVIYNDTPQGRECRTSTQLYSDKEENIVILKSPLYLHDSAETGDSDKLKAGQKVIAIGGTENLNKSITEGTIEDFININGKKYIQISNPVSDTSKGGGLYNMQGELIGILNRKAYSGKNYNLAIPINDFKTAIEEGNDKYNVPLNKKLADVLSYLEYNDDYMLFNNLSLNDTNNKVYHAHYALFEEFEGTETFINLFKEKEFREFFTVQLLKVHELITDSGYKTYEVRIIVGDKMLIYVCSNNRITVTRNTIDTTYSKELPEFFKEVLEVLK